MPQTDAAAVALARDGDSEAFRALVERHGRAVYRVAHRMTGNAHDAEDVVQETFLRAYKQLQRFESRANFGTWLHRIAVNCSIDLIRARPHRESGHDSTDLEQIGAGSVMQESGQQTPERLMLSTEVSERVTAAMGGLSRMERAAFVLRHFEGQSIDEISRTLGVKTNATKHSIFRAVRKMRAALEPFIAADDRGAGDEEAAATRGSLRPRSADDHADAPDGRRSRSPLLRRNVQRGRSADHVASG